MPITSQEASEQAVHKAKSAKMADEVSREVHQQEILGQTKSLVIEALREVFGEGDQGADPNKMNILVRRIPFICNDIAQIHKDNAESKESIAKINSNISKVVWLVLSAVILAVLKLVLIP